MKIYVAGRFQSYHKVRWVMDELTKLGHTITYDWTRSAEFNSYGEHHRVQAATPRKDLIRYAQLDIQGVRESEALVLCADDSMAGAWIEVGIAIERSIPIHAVKVERWTIFLELPFVTQHQTYKELFDLFDPAGRLA